MKKIIVCLLVLFFANLVYGQQELYRVVIRNYYFEHYGGSAGCNSHNNIVSIYIIYKDGTKEVVYAPPGYSAERDVNVPVLVQDTYRLYSGKEPYQLHYYAYLRANQGHGGSCGHEAVIDEYVDIPNGCVTGHFAKYADGGNPAWLKASFDYDIYPIINLVQPINTIIGSDDAVNVSVDSNSRDFSPSSYNWQYQVVQVGNVLQSNQWIDLPEFNGQNNINFIPSSHFTWNGIDSKVYFRIKSCYENYSDNVVSYDLKKSSPRLTGAQTQDAKCFRSSDGQVRFTFDRELDPEETLSFSIVDLDNQVGINDGIPLFSVVTSRENITALTEENTTFTGLPAGHYRLQIIGKYKGNSTYTDGVTNTIDFTIDEPEPVIFNLSKTVNIWCNGGNDGQIEITADGGQGSYLYQVKYNGNFSEWTAFNNGKKALLTGLAPGTYDIQVKDTNGCLAKELVYDSDGKLIGTKDEAITKTATLTEPAKAVTVEYKNSKDPTAFGFTNGSIQVQITGGTPLSGSKPYNYTWKYEDGTTWNDVTEETIAGNEGWFLTLKNAKAGKYILTVTDANYSSATDKNGCTVSEFEFTLSQPDPMKASVAVSQQISCNVQNEYGDETDIYPKDGQRDESQDGALTATVTGGTKPYVYTWKKQINGVWTVISTHTDTESSSAISNLSDGNYAFNVKDAQGNILGDYQDNSLIAEKDEIFYLHEPPILKLSLQSTDVNCYPGNNGTIKALPSGGIAPYSYQWSNGETTQQIDSLIAGTYKVVITDARGCRVEGNIVLNQPASLRLIANAVNPTCYGGMDGLVTTTISGGVAPYKYQWSNGQTTPNISGLSKGEYTLTVTDTNSCSAVIKVEITDPEPIVINLGGDRVLCNGQTLSVDASIGYPNTTYQWTSDNGFTANTAQVTLANAGTYTVTAVTPKGCTATGKITISRSNTDISSEFLLASQAYVGEEVILVNVSQPLGQTTTWKIPQGVETVSQADREISLMFPKEGTYTIGLISTQGDCSQYYEKNIIVEKNSRLPDPGTTTPPFIQEFTLVPNPNNGVFTIKVKLAEESPISLRIFNISGALVSGEKKLQGQKEYEVNYQLSGLAPSTYVIVMETAKQTQVKRMITY